MAKKEKEEGKIKTDTSKEVHDTISDIKNYVAELYKNKYIKRKDLKFFNSKLEQLMEKDGIYDAGEVLEHELEKYKKELYDKFEDGIIEVKIKPLYKGVRLPQRQFKLDAGTDAYITCFLEILENGAIRPLPNTEIKLKSLGRVVCGLGFATEIPKGYYGQVVPRSGLALRHGLTVINSPGTIDAGYRNEWTAIMVNLSNRSIVLSLGDRICQIIIRKMVNFTFVTVERLEESDRDMSGFGSTG